MADLELNSIGNGDGNNYLLRDNSKIPKAGGNVLDGTEYSRTVDNSKLIINGGTSILNGGSAEFFGKDHTSLAGFVSLKAQDSNKYSQLIMQPSGTFQFTNGDTTKNVAMQEDVVPRSGGGVMTSNRLGRADFNGELSLCGGMDLDHGSSVCVFGKSYPNFGLPGAIRLITNDGSNYRNMYMFPNGTWQWEGQAVQITSDQRLKQQISEIDDKLLDAWEDVEPCQFKYNDAVDAKKDKARLHTGYVVQQIDEACKSHNIDISNYGLYCHEEYPERTEEVEVQQEDGTTKKETKVIEEASEHYSLRYTETLVVECAYLRRENDKLKQQIQQILETLELHSKILNSIN